MSLSPKICLLYVYYDLGYKGACFEGYDVKLYNIHMYVRCRKYSHLCSVTLRILIHNKGKPFSILSS